MLVSLFGKERMPVDVILTQPGGEGKQTAAVTAVSIGLTCALVSSGPPLYCRRLNLKQGTISCDHARSLSHVIVGFHFSQTRTAHEQNLSHMAVFGLTNI